MIDDRNFMTALLGIVAVIAVGVVLDAAQVVILPLMIAWLLSYIFAPVVRRLIRYHINIGFAVMCVILFLLAVCYLGGMFVYARVASFAQEYEAYAQRFTEISADITTRLPYIKSSLAEVDWLQLAGKRIVAFSGSFVGFVSNLVMVLIFLVFMLLGKPYMKAKIRYAFPGGRSARVTDVLDSIAGQISRYLTAKLVISLITGLLVWGAMTAIGVDFPMTWGAIAFFLNFIPTIGSIIAGIPPTLMALVQFYPNYWMAVLTALIFMIIQVVMGNGVEPKMMGERLNLSPLVVLIALVFWGWLWGFIGALLAVPIAAAIKIVCENIEPLRPISIMMESGKRFWREEAQEGA
ncbi:AI-2E family transporter [Kiritimatiella glycovorans]|uniref:Putative transport protein n=1 Tax=Kiritimatiella glycovorans TaxID=1307763 RepID=A0A0G3EEE7_9BACT|nr:AI-2E family transporter [Kiritimatiella glycovorans]AKJ64708.1 putative transport protein [Kiritimatiella glycovorans]